MRVCAVRDGLPACLLLHTRDVLPACLLLLHKHTPVCSASLWMTGKETMKLSSTKCGNCRGGREEVVVVGGCERW